MDILEDALITYRYFVLILTEVMLIVQISILLNSFLIVFLKGLVL